MKLPSGEVSVHETTPTAFQKTVVRAPTGTLAGTAQMSTLGGTVEPVGVGTGVGVGLGLDLVTLPEEETTAGAGCPTLNPRNVQRLSKKLGGMMDERKFAVHGRVAHMFAITSFGAPFAFTP